MTIRIYICVAITYILQDHIMVLMIMTGVGICRRLREQFLIEYKKRIQFCSYSLNGFVKIIIFKPELRRTLINALNQKHI